MIKAPFNQPKQSKKLLRYFCPLMPDILPLGEVIKWRNQFTYM